VAVQHHHAHVASCLAEHAVTEPAIGVAFDGTGLGTDGAIWGGEFLLVDRAHAQRMAHLGYVPLPGGDAAARHPWRAAAAHLWGAYGGELELLTIPWVERREPGEWRLIRQMLARRVNSPPTSSAGRLFDAVASLVGLCDTARFEAQAAAALESAAAPETTRSYPVELHEDAAGWVAEPAPIVRGVVGDLAAGRAAPEIAGAFHNALRDLIVVVVTLVRRRTGVRRVVLTGGVFQNALLTGRTAEALGRAGFEVLLHRRVPCNDGGLSLGQVSVAGMTGALCA
jgi:hydrogenase maturation protein HypF